MDEVHRVADHGTLSSRDEQAGPLCLALETAARSASVALMRGPEVLDAREVDFEYDGEMTVDVALNTEAMKHYPFCRLSGPANVLVMPGINSAHLGTVMLQELGGGTVIGPVADGLPHDWQLSLEQLQGPEIHVSDCVQLLQHLHRKCIGYWL